VNTLFYAEFVICVFSDILYLRCCGIFYRWFVRQMPWVVNFYARTQLLLSGRLSHCNSVRPSVTRVDQSKAVQARITKSSLSAA